MSIRITSGSSSLRLLDRLAAGRGETDDVDAAVAAENGAERLGEEAVVVGDQNTHGHDFLESEQIYVEKLPISIDSLRMEDARERIHNLLLTGDNRLKQGVSAEKVRASYEEALAVAREAGLEEQIRPLVEVRLADLERLAGESPPPSPPAA